MWQDFIIWVVCKVFKHHSWVLIERYQPKVKAQIFTGEGFEEKFIDSPFKPEGTQGKWKCGRCSQVSVGTLHNAYHGRQ